MPSLVKNVAEMPEGAPEDPYAVFDDETSTHTFSKKLITNLLTAEQLIDVLVKEGYRGQLKSELDNNGYPILFAARHPVAAAQSHRSQCLAWCRSGNPTADPASGRFSGIRQPKTGGVADVNLLLPITRTTAGRHTGGVGTQARCNQDAARVEEMNARCQGLPQRQGADVSKVDGCLIAEVREQRIDDLIDVLDNQLRTKVDGSQRARRFVRLQAPRGFVKRLFASLSDDEVIKVTTRLANRGWGVDDLVSQIISRVSKQDRRTQLEERFRSSAGQIKKLSDDDWTVGRYRPDFEGEEFEFDDDPQPVHVELPSMPQAPSALELADALGKVAAAMPVPVINVEAPQITVEAAKPVNKRVIRDDDGNLIGIENAED